MDSCQRKEIVLLSTEASFCGDNKVKAEGKAMELLMVTGWLAESLQPTEFVTSKETKNAPAVA